MRSGVQDQPGLDGKTPCLLKIQKLARHRHHNLSTLHMEQIHIPGPPGRTSQMGTGMFSTTSEEMRSCYVAQAGLRLLASSNPPTLPSQCVEVRGWSATVRSWLTATSAFRFQMILLPQPFKCQQEEGTLQILQKKGKDSSLPLLHLPCCHPGPQCNFLRTPGWAGPCSAPTAPSGPADLLLPPLVTTPIQALFCHPQCPSPPDKALPPGHPRHPPASPVELQSPLRPPPTVRRATELSHLRDPASRVQLMPPPSPPLTRPGAAGQANPEKPRTGCRE
ncbi:hypothetical protein AAY473_021449 [Plecturocebus cupreus]